MSDARTFTGEELAAMPVGTLIEVSQMRDHDPEETFLVLHVAGDRKGGGAATTGGGGVAHGRHWTDVADWGLIRVLHTPATAESHDELAAQVAGVETLASNLEGPTISGEYNAVGHAVATEIRAALRPPTADAR